MFKPVRQTGPTRAATAAQVAGIIGIVVCIVLIVVAWIGRGALVGAIDDLATSVGGGIDRATAATSQVADRIDTAAAGAASLAAQANQLAANPPVPEAVASLADRVGTLEAGYAAVRVQYAELRENVTTAAASLQHVARFVPGVQAPAGPTEKLQAIDAKLQSIDATITGLWPSFEGGRLTSAAATKVADGVTAVGSALSDASAAVRGLSADLTALGDRADAFADNLRTLVTIGVVAISLLFVWVLILNVALWQLGRIWKRQAAA
jgi:hypothetical protein